MGDYIACGDYDHIIAGKGEGVVAGAEKTEDGIHPQKGHRGEQQAYQDVEGERVGKDSTCLVVFTASEKDGNKS